MFNPRVVLNKLKWCEGFVFDDVEIWYVHRGAIGDKMTISGCDIVDLQRSFMKTVSAMVPYHRVFKIVYQGDVVFERNPKK